MSDTCLAYERRGAVAIITIDDAPYNRMSLAFTDALEPLVATIGSDATIRAVVITASGDLAACKQALQSGATAWLDKPVDDRVLLDTIAQALSEYAFLPEVLD